MQSLLAAPKIWAELIRNVETFACLIFGPAFFHILHVFQYITIFVSVKSHAGKIGFILDMGGQSFDPAQRYTEIALEAPRRCYASKQ